MPDAEEEKSEKKEKGKEKGLGKKHFKKIPPEVLFSPGGVLLIFLAGIMEISDFFIPPALADSLILELIPELIFVIFLSLITRQSIKDGFKAMIWPLVIERFDFLGIIPSFLIKLFM